VNSAIGLAKSPTGDLCRSKLLSFLSQYHRHSPVIKTVDRLFSYIEYRRYKYVVDSTQNVGNPKFKRVNSIFVAIFSILWIIVGVLGVICAGLVFAFLNIIWGCVVLITSSFYITTGAVGWAAYRSRTSKRSEGLAYLILTGAIIVLSASCRQER